MRRRPRRALSDSILDAAVLAEGRILSWSWDKTLRLWDGHSGKCLAVLEGHLNFVSSMLALPDSRILSWSGADGVRLWDNLGSPIAWHSFENGLLLFPELRSAIGGEHNLQPSCLWGTANYVGLLRLFGEASEAVFRWQSDATCTARYLLPDGRALLSQATGQLCFLQLHHGNRPISTAELERLELESASRRNPREIAIVLEELAAEGRQAVAEELSQKQSKAIRGNGEISAGITFPPT